MASDVPHEHATQLRNHWWWRPGWREGREFYTWHLTFEGQTDLHRLVTQYQQALANVPGLDLIPLEWLHLTMQGVGFTDEVSDHDIRKIADAAAKHLAKSGPIELTFDTPVIRPEALAIRPNPTDSLIKIRRAIRHGVADVWNDDHVPETGNRFEPHLSLAYINTDGPAVAVHAALSDVQTRPVHIYIEEVSLIILRREDHLYLWRDLAKLALK